MNKSIPMLTTSQVTFNELNPNSIGLIVNKSHPSINATLEYLISCSQIFKSLYMRQETIAKYVGYGERTIRRSLSYLHSFGFIFKHKRSGKRTCEYFVNGFFFTAPGRLILIIIFSISFLCVGFEPYGRQLILTNVNKNEFSKTRATADDVFVPNFYKNVSGTNIFLNDNIASQNIRSKQEAYDLERAKISGEPNKKITLEQFGAIYFPEKEKVMNKTPQTGYMKTKSSVAAKASVAWQDDNDNIRHRLIERREKIRVRAISLGIETEGYTIAEIENMIRGYQVIPLGVGIPNRRQLVDKQPVTKHHDLNWNDLLPTQPESVTASHILTQPVLDNAPDFMSEQYIGEEYGEFEEVLD